MSKQKVTVVIDSREDEDVIADLAAEFSMHDEVEDYRVEELPAGDLEIEGIGFERKTFSDYVSSMQEWRLDEQAVKMNQRYEHGYFLMEGNLVETENPFEAANSNIAPTSVRGSMASLAARQGLPVIPCSNRALLADMAVRIARKHIEETQKKRFITGAVSGTDEPTAKMMYACIDGIGPEKAEVLYQTWPSVTEFMTNADADDVADLEGFGEKTAEKVMEGFR